ncbi:MAG: hypothetical protein IAX21_06735 [Candidatus Bathyarchaeota archaeon]|nr:hypothetical protein [Candidatus Bathyarchaeum tardum]WGM89360.1 MAG: hypothetical protein NUK63_10725 [Candidatus Bathyarchaeum tardum]WNZ28366.1 MAG: hypothetical protein IAX21_06735 [Candidatus Bathyarchaeota archaeon]
MRKSKKVIGIPKNTFIIGVIIAAIVGAALSFGVTTLLNVNIGNTIPENTTIAVTDVNIDVQNADSFSITVLNPTYSPTEAKIKEIMVITENDEIHNILSVNPQLPYELNKGETQIFECKWTWGDYIGKNINIVVVVEDGSGAVYELETAAIGLEIKSSAFSGADTEHFTLTIGNPEESEVDFTITKIVVTLENGTDLDIRNVSPALPTVISKDSTITITCAWNWDDYRDKDITITAYTSQGYKFSLERSTPKLSQILVKDVTFDPTSLQTFDITVENSENSAEPATIVAIEIITDTTTINVPVILPQTLPYEIPIGQSVTMTCAWDWSATRNQNIVITVETSEGFLGYSYETTS